MFIVQENICCGEQPKSASAFEVGNERIPVELELARRRSAAKTSIGSEELGDGALIQETCPQCDHDEMNFHTLQMRSAD